MISLSKMIFLIKKYIDIHELSIYFLKNARCRLFSKTRVIIRKNAIYAYQKWSIFFDEVISKKPTYSLS